MIDDDDDDYGPRALAKHLGGKLCDIKDGDIDAVVNIMLLQHEPEPRLALGLLFAKAINIVISQAAHEMAFVNREQALDMAIAALKRAKDKG